MSLYQSGLAQDVLVNIHPMGVTENGMFRFQFGSVLNFRDSIIQFVSGHVKLLGHCIDGMVGATFAYSLSGVDEEDAEGEAQAQAAGESLSLPVEEPAAPAPKRGNKRRKTIIVPPPQENLGLYVAREDDEDEDEASGSRTPRTTPRTVSGAVGMLDAGLTLSERLAVINGTLNKDYKHKDAAKPGYGKICNWPLTVCLTREGYIRSRWSCFALLACEDVNFFRQLGYADHQIRSFHLSGVAAYSLGSLPVSEGDVTAVNRPAMNAVSIARSRFFLVPRRVDLSLRLEAYAHNVPATASDLRDLFEIMLSNANYRYRASVLEQLYETKYIWPSTGRYDYDPGTGMGVATIAPSNIFPMTVEYENDAIVLNINTRTGAGSIRDVAFDKDNPFGMPSKTHAWDDVRRRNKFSRVVGSGELGIGGQECEISSTMLFQGRGTLTNDSVQAPICAIFMDPSANPTPLTTFFPKNRLSSSISYSYLDYNCKSRYRHDTLKVTNEVYSYSLVGEIRNVGD